MSIYNIVDFGAKGDGVTSASQAIKNAIEKCAENGGGTIYVPAGKFLTGAIIVFTMLLTAVGVSAQVNVVVDGEKLELKNEAFIEDGRTLIPVRAIFEALDAKVLWFEDRRLVVAFSGNSMLQIGINSDSLYVNDDEIPLDVPARIVDDRTYIPLRAVSEALGAVVDWNTRKLRIYYGACDTCIGLAEGDVDEIVDACLKEL